MMYIPLTSHINSMFLSDIEKDTIAGLSVKGKLYRDANLISIKYFHVKNYTVCVVEYEDGEERVGVSKRNPIDRPSKVKGEAVAFVRAISK